MESQIQLKDSIHEHWRKYRELFPGMADAYDRLPQEAYAGGRFDAKTKRIMAVAVAVASGCRGCMLYQTDEALNLGADAEEILEACGVAISLGGTMAAAETTRVVQFLEERGAL